MSSINGPNGTAYPGTAVSVSPDEVAALNGAVGFLILTAICTGVLIPVGVTLFFSFSRMWRTPVFIFNVFAVILGFAYGGLAISYIQTVFSGSIPDSRVALVFMTMSFLIPVCVQAILILRVIAVYPPRALNWARKVLIYGPFIALSIGRIVNMVLYLKNVSQVIGQSGANATIISFYVLHRPNAKAEWILQSVNDLYASGLFLLQLKKSRIFRNKEGGLASIFTNGGSNSYTTRLKALFWIAVFNFVFPVILNIIIVVFSFRVSNMLHVVDVITLNIYFEIVCVLMATIWCTGTYWDSTSPSLAGNKPLALGDGSTTESLASAKFATRSVAEPHFLPSDV